MTASVNAVENFACLGGLFQNTSENIFCISEDLHMGPSPRGLLRLAFTEELSTLNFVRALVPTSSINSS